MNYEEASDKALDLSAFTTRQLAQLAATSKRFTMNINLQWRWQSMISKTQRNSIKREIIKELTDSKHGLFNKQTGNEIYHGTNLDMVMESVQRALTRMVSEND